ncbi:hypothetical protein [Sharpea porci]|uniref:hypothetical protein n=1 Tax=Sharpea porci TaxID=2652286 RepID=UPI002A90D6B8|nr:hypothetical protein [Sharpea porci]MDY5278259.1 hypothetical protein [Sharpea porci]
MVVNAFFLVTVKQEANLGYDEDPRFSSAFLLMKQGCNQNCLLTVKQEANLGYDEMVVLVSRKERKSTL